VVVREGGLAGAGEEIVVRIMGDGEGERTAASRERPSAHKT
jgi:hypothetical protein